MERRKKNRYDKRRLNKNYPCGKNNHLAFTGTCHVVLKCFVRQVKLSGLFLAAMLGQFYTMTLNMCPPNNVVVLCDEIVPIWASHANLGLFL